MNNYKRKLISFCIWGNSNLYNLGLLENAILMPKIFPGWIMHVIYTKTANQKIKARHDKAQDWMTWRAAAQQQPNQNDYEYLLAHTRHFARIIPSGICRRSTT